MTDKEFVNHIKSNDLIRVWFFSSDRTFARLIVHALGDGFESHESQMTDFDSLQEQEPKCDAVLIDCRRGDAVNGQAQACNDLISELRGLQPPPPIITIVDDENHTSLHQHIKEGSFDTISTPPNVLELRRLLRRAAQSRRAEQELRRLRSRDDAQEELDGLIGCSESMQQVFALVRKIAPYDVTTFISGETGTGKSVMARAIHRLSARSNGPFIAFSCANLPEELVEEELFGHEKGAFTDAITTRRGRLEAADQGTFFLDEIGDLPLALQAKLLHVLQERSFERLGSNIPIAVDIRLICATHRHLEEMVQEGRFREDLYYRLNVVQLHIPPLRERQDAIPTLAHHFLQSYAKRFGRKADRFSRTALQALEEYAWPGNVRELENVVQRAVVMMDGSSVEVWHLPKAIMKGLEEAPIAQSYEEQVREFKRRLIARALTNCSGSKAEAARSLQIARSYLHRLISELQILTGEAASTSLSTNERVSQSRLM